MRIIQILGMFSGIVMPLFNIPLILRIFPAAFFGRYQSGLGNRRLVLCPRHAAVEPAVCGSGSSGIWNH
jgi:hypothetical protein